MTARSIRSTDGLLLAEGSAYTRRAGVHCTRLTTNGATAVSSRVLAGLPMSVQQVGSPLALRFGPFELNVAERSLKKANQVIPLGGRAYDILMALLERAGEVVPKADLIAK